MNNDEKIKDILQNEEIPEQLSPENIKLMLYERSPKKKKGAVVWVRRFAAAAAAVAVIISGGTAYLKHYLFTINNKDHAIADFRKESFRNKDGSFMSGASDYDQIFEIFQKANKNYNKIHSPSDEVESCISSAAADSLETQNFFNNDTAPEHSDTYDQEAGVLEADIIKTDGKLIYKLDTSNYDVRIRVLSADNGAMEQLAYINVSDVVNDVYDNKFVTYNIAKNMFLYNDMVIITGSAYVTDPDQHAQISDYYERNIPMEFDYKCVDIQSFTAVYSAGEAPELLNVFYQDGSFNDTRITPDGYMYVVSEYLSENIDSSSPEELASFVPQYGKIDDTEFMAPEDILLPDGYIPPSQFLPYTIISSLDLNFTHDPQLIDKKALADCTGDLYCSADNMYISYGWGDSTITRIALENGSIQPKSTGEVKGTVKDQFSMSEYNGYFRVASTGFSWLGSCTNYMTVLDMDMNNVSIISDIGENEKIKSVNFQGDMAYVVTFRYTDPLYGIDLSDPEHPKITDSLKVDGYSDYLQKWSDGLLLSTGETTDNISAGYGVKLEMFDTSDPNDLKECGVWTLSDEFHGITTFSESDRKALLIAPEKNLIAFPICVNMVSSYLFFSYENGEFILNGSLSNDYEADEGLLFRALYIGNYLYVFSNNNAISADMDTFTETDRISFGDDGAIHKAADPDPVFYENGTIFNSQPDLYEEVPPTGPTSEQQPSGTWIK